ncbi:hypothetical protein [Brevundimonas diminuta]|uniref:hypothetical protein n=1 Tax=Brevundimonas diminuta TaxID=293 RepID=UPI0030F85AD3
MTTPRVTVPVEPTDDERAMLEYLVGVEGADIWNHAQAGVCRSLEGRKLVRIVKAKNAPKDGAARQPYFGVKITRAGMKAIGHD